MSSPSAPEQMNIFNEWMYAAVSCAIFSFLSDWTNKYKYEVCFGNFNFEFSEDWARCESNGKNIGDLFLIF